MLNNFFIKRIFEEEAVFFIVLILIIGSAIAVNIPMEISNEGKLSPVRHGLPLFTGKAISNLNLAYNLNFKILDADIEDNNVNVLIENTGSLTISGLIFRIYGENNIYTEQRGYIDEYGFPSLSLNTLEIKEFNIVVTKNLGRLNKIEVIPLVISRDDFIKGRSRELQLSGNILVEEGKGYLEQSERQCNLLMAYFEQPSIKKSTEENNLFNNLFVRDKDPVNLVLESDNCINETAEFIIKEKEMFSETEIIRLRSLIDKNVLKVRWNAVWFNDSPFLFFRDDPEYVFSVRVLR